MGVASVTRLCGKIWLKSYLILKNPLFIDRFSNAYIYCHVISGIAVLYGSGSRSTRAL